MLIFEKSRPGRGCDMLPECDVEVVTLSEKDTRKTPLHLPELSEGDIGRHYSELTRKAQGVNDGFYPLGSCTMKYNPRVNEDVAALSGFTEIHPLQPLHTVQGALEVMKELEQDLLAITGMDRISMQPAAGAQGELTGLLMIRAYQESQGESGRTKILIPDSAHGTNPASAVMAGYQVVTLPSGEDGCVDIEKLKEAANEDVAGLMLTNPNTLGLFDENIAQITQIVHECGGLCYYDGANLNAIMGKTRPGDMGFDIVHVNLHKTFATPHGGGGPGSGPVGCKKELSEFLPGVLVEEGEELFFRKPEHSIGEMKNFYGNFLVLVRALAYITSLGKEGIREASENAVLNANYMKHRLKEVYPMAYDGPCMHEFVMTLAPLKKETGVTAADMAKGLLDYGIHPPTMYFPLIVEEAFMLEPTETEAKETLDRAAEVFIRLYEEALQNPEALKSAPRRTPVGRLNETEAARHPVIRYTFEGDDNN